jgi:hypothetical protein
MEKVFFGCSICILFLTFSSSSSNGSKISFGKYRFRDTA